MKEEQNHFFWRAAEDVLNGIEIDLDLRFVMLDPRIQIASLYFISLKIQNHQAIFLFKNYIHDSFENGPIILIGERNFLLMTT